MSSNNHNDKTTIGQATPARAHYFWAALSEQCTMALGRPLASERHHESARRNERPSRGSATGAAVAYARIGQSGPLTGRPIEFLAPTAPIASKCNEFARQMIDRPRPADRSCSAGRPALAVMVMNPSSRLWLSFTIDLGRFCPRRSNSPDERPLSSLLGPKPAILPLC